MSSTRSSIVIVGAGLSGLTLARALSYSKIPFRIFEKAPASAQGKRNNHAITLHPWCYERLLSALGIARPAFEKELLVAGWGSVGRDGSLRVHRGKLDRWLANGIDVQWGSTVKAIDTSSEKPSVIFESENGNEPSKVDANIVIGADGVHSSVRKSVMPSYDLTVLPYVVINGRRKVEQDDGAGQEAEAKLARSELATCNTRLGQSMLSVSRVEPGHISYTFSRPARSDNDPLHKPDRSNAGAKDIPEALFEELGDLQKLDLEQPFRWVFDPALVRQDRLLHWLMRLGNVPKDSLITAASKGVLLFGDSSHARPILGGNGANEAILDALHLADMLEDGADHGDLKEFVEQEWSEWQKNTGESENRLKDMHGGEHASQL